MWRAVKNHQVVVVTDLQGLLHCTEAFHGDHRFQTTLKPPRLPVETCALGDVEVGDLNIPARRRVFTRYEAGEGTLTHAPFLGDHPKKNRHDRRARYHERTQARKHDKQQGQGATHVRGTRGTQDGDRVGLHGVDTGERALRVVDGEAFAFSIAIGALKHVDLGGPQTIPIGDQEDSAGALVLNHSKEPFSFVLVRKVIEQCRRAA